jgi:hypothetical protein
VTAKTDERAELVEDAESERWRTMPIDEETVDRLRRLLFGQHTRPGK